MVSQAFRADHQPRPQMSGLDFVFAPRSSAPLMDDDQTSPRGAHGNGEAAESEGPLAEQYVALDDDSEAEDRGDNGESEGGESDEQGPPWSTGTAQAEAEAANWVSFTPAAPAASPALLPPTASAATPEQDDFGDFVGDASPQAEAGGGTSPTDGASGGASFADFGEIFGEMPNFVTTDGPTSLGVRTHVEAAAGPAAAPLAASDVALIKETMAALTIIPPPWIRKMEQLRAVQQAQAAFAAGVGGSAAAAACAASVEGGAPGMAGVDVSHHWEVQVSARAGQLLPDAKHLLTGDTIANASPFLPVGSGGRTDAEERGARSAGAGGGDVPGAHTQFMAVPVARKKVTGRQLAAERRKDREERKRRQAAEAAGAT